MTRSPSLSARSLTAGSPLCGDGERLRWPGERTVLYITAEHPFLSVLQCAGTGDGIRTASLRGTCAVERTAGRRASEAASVLAARSSVTCHV